MYYQFIPYCAHDIRKHTRHTRILKPSEDSLLTGLKVDVAANKPVGIK